MEYNKDEKETTSCGLKASAKNNKKKVFYSPNTKAKILTPIKSALQKANKNPYKFIKEIQSYGLFDNTNKENIQDDEF